MSIEPLAKVAERLLIREESIKLCCCVPDPPAREKWSHSGVELLELIDTVKGNSGHVPFLVTHG